MRRTFAVLASLPLLALATTVAAQPSTDLHDYVLFASTAIRLKSATILSGDVGVNDFEGRLIGLGGFTAPSSIVAADEVRFDNDPTLTLVQQLYANIVDSGPNGVPFATPIITDVATACGFPLPFPICESEQPVQVDPGITVTLQPGVYGTLRMRGTPAAAGIVELVGGNYTFCDVKLSRNAEIRALSNATLAISGKASFGPNTLIGPDGGSGLTAGDIELFVAGSIVKFSRGSYSQIHVCAPNAKLKMSADGTHVGMHVAASIRAQPVTLALE